MHREIMGCPTKKQIDHINNDPLDNRRSNLRVCSHAENSRNRRMSSGKLKGVLWKSKNRWQARIRVNGNLKVLGSYLSPQDAASAYDKAAVKYFGEFANINGR